MCPLCVWEWIVEANTICASFFFFSVKLFLIFYMINIGTYLVVKPQLSTSYKHPSFLMLILVHTKPPGISQLQFSFSDLSTGSPSPFHPWVFALVITSLYSPIYPTLEAVICPYVLPSHQGRTVDFSACSAFYLSEQTSELLIWRTGYQKSYLEILNQRGSEPVDTRNSWG